MSAASKTLPCINVVFTCPQYYLLMPQEPLHIEDITGTPDECRVMRLSGPVTISNFFQFQSFVRGNTSRKLILDLSGVPYIDSAGIGALVGAYVNHQKDGRTLALVGVTKRVRDAMQVTRVEQFFRFYETEAAAHEA